MRKYFIALLYLCHLPLCVIAQNGVTSSLFTGRMNYTIPIYTVEDPDFHLDIALRYSTEGFKPFQPSGCYGQDWSLVAGGCITRTVQGYADDQKIRRCDELGDAKDTIVGMTRAIQNGNVPDKDLVYYMDASVYDTCGIVYLPEEWRRCYHKVDYQPDIFSFNFCGYKGRFIVNNEGIPKIISGDFVMIDITEMKDDTGSNHGTTFSAPSGDSQISFYTTDGYKYIFGGTSTAIEYTVLTKRGGNLQWQLSPAVSTWHLTKIIAPNGRSMTFSYSYGIQNYYTPNSLHSFITDYDWTESTEDTIHIVYSLHKECLLHSISTSDSVPLRISFVAHEESHKMYENDDFTSCKPHSQLDSIIVSYDGDTIRTATLSYSYRNYQSVLRLLTDKYWWRYLEQVKISGVGAYTMTYNYVDLNAGLPFPAYMSNYPTLSPSNDTQYKNKVDRFGFWKQTPMQGLLSEVALPTGGKLKFTYEEHQYGEERRFRTIGTKNVELYTLSGTNQAIGGVRIEKIETLSNDSTLIETKTFSYNKQGTSNSSGIYYNIYNVFYPDTLLPIANPLNYGLISSHIGYSYVEQLTTIGTDSYKTAYTFDTGRNSYSSLNNSHINRNENVINYKDTTEVCSGSLTFDGWLIAPGKLLRTDLYNGTTLAKSVQYQYNGVSETAFGPWAFGANSLGCTDTIVCLSKYSAHAARMLFVCPDVIEQVTTHEYSQNGQVMESTVNYTYDSKLRKKVATTTDSRGILHFTKYTYPDEITDHYPHPYHLLSIANRIGHPVEVYSGYIQNSTEYVTEGTIEFYAYNAYSLHGQQHFKPYLHEIWRLAPSEPVADYQPISNPTGNQLSYDRRYALVTEYHYDLKNRLQWVKPFGQATTTYTWDGIYPVTKTIGNQTWTYTYKPYVGVSSVTDPRGITTYYAYDAKGRLIEEYRIVNGQKQILNAYQYHIKTE